MSGERSKTAAELMQYAEVAAQVQNMIFGGTKHKKLQKYQTAFQESSKRMTHRTESGKVLQAIHRILIIHDLQPSWIGIQIVQTVAAMGFEREIVMDALLTVNDYDDMSLEQQLGRSPLPDSTPGTR